MIDKVHNLVVSHEGAEQQAAAQALALRLGFPWVQRCDQGQGTFALMLTPQHLELRSLQERMNPIYVDLIAGRVAMRSKTPSYKNELITRACGLKPGLRPTIVDGTAGLGRDAFILNQLQCPVLMVERSPIVAALLRDGLQRLLATAPPSASLQLIETDIKEYLMQLHPEDYPDVIYLDPIFPERDKTALVKKEMRMLKSIVGADEDMAAVLPLALQRCKRRVVVKRPRYAETLTKQSPDIRFDGKSIRFDVYLRF